MAWVAVDKDGGEYIYENTPQRLDDCWHIPYSSEFGVLLPKGSIKKLIGRDLTWEDNTVELREE